MAEPFFAYMVRCSDGSYYVGHTDHLERRIAEHQEGGKCVYTSRRRPVALVWSQEFQTREDAKEVEHTIKKWSRAKKEALCGDDSAALRELAKKRDWAGFRERRAARLCAAPSLATPPSAAPRDCGWETKID